MTKSSVSQVASPQALPYLCSTLHLILLVVSLAKGKAVLKGLPQCHHSGTIVHDET